MDTLHLEAIISAVLFVGVRVGCVMLFAPFFSGESIPAQVKMALTVALTALLYPVCRPITSGGGPIAWVQLVSAEAVAGLLLGLAMQFVIEAAQFAGQILGVQAGYSLVTLLDPQTRADTPVMATFQQLLALLMFLQLNVHHWLLRGLATSFAYLPPGGGWANFRSCTALLRAAGGIWLAGMQMASPIVIVTLLVDVTLGFLAKASPQMPVLFLGLPVKILLALTVFAGMLFAWPAIFERRFADGFSLGERLLHLAH
jgi:flagellar biosynthesis protein FliR